MIFVISAMNIEDALSNADDLPWFAYLSDAQQAAKRRSEEDGETWFVYSFKREVSQ